MLDVYLAGACPGHVADFLYDIKASRLHTQLTDRKAISRLIMYADSGDYAQKLFIDSGAYSAYTLGKEIDVDEYIEYVNAIDDYVTLFAQVDKIPGKHGQPKTKKEVLDAPRQSFENYLYMRERVKSPHKLLPVFHRREDWAWLEKIISEGAGYIGLAPTTDSSEVEKKVFFEKCFDIIKRSKNPNIKTHAFGVTSLPMLSLFPFTSADSTGWIMKAANGIIILPWGVIPVTHTSRVLPRGKNNHLLNMGKKGEKAVKFIEGMGYDIERLASDYAYRWMFNAQVLTEWARVERDKPTHFKSPLF
jgi:hypothetical protein